MGEIVDKVMKNVPKKPEKPQVPKRDIPDKTPNYVARNGFDCDDYSDLEKNAHELHQPQFYRSHWR